MNRKKLIIIGLGAVLLAMGSAGVTTAATADVAAVGFMWATDSTVKIGALGIGATGIAKAITAATGATVSTGGLAIGLGIVA